MAGRLAGKVAVVTGASSGMGLVTAKRFVEEGAQVVIIGRREKELSEAAAQIGGNVIVVRGDVSRLEDLDRLYSVVQEKHGRIDILFANAGISEFSPVAAVTEEHFDRLFDINVKGLYFTVQRALPLLKDGASIVLNASISGNRVGMEALSVYGATKAAVRSFARTLSIDLKTRKIRVNSLSPGAISTGILGKMGLDEKTIAEAFSAVAAQIPTGRIGTSEEIASTVLFLASDESSYINGVDLVVDGGMSQV
jgi:NAD(P)-dependent dehydrogenase (short-subunit alcohol dehydrogenase family)